METRKRTKVSVERLQAKKSRNQKIVMVTAYDYPSALIVEESGVDIAFVGDSLAMTVLGYPSTVSVTLDEMVLFMAAVARGATTPLLLGDLPFGSYLTAEQGLQSSARILKAGGMDAVKLEGGAGIADVVHAISSRGIPVMSHIGLTPQTSAAHGGFRVQGKQASQALGLLEDAVALEQAGAFAVVLELVPVEVAAAISRRLTIPTIGIGSGIECDGQVLVWHDLLGLSDLKPRHTKPYADLGSLTLAALQTYASEVRAGGFPTEDQTWHMPDEEKARLEETSRT